MKRRAEATAATRSPTLPLRAAKILRRQLLCPDCGAPLAEGICPDCPEIPEGYDPIDDKADIR